LISGEGHIDIAMPLFSDATQEVLVIIPGRFHAFQQDAVVVFDELGVSMYHQGL
jgi:hypothetical protein